MSIINMNMKIILAAFAVVMFAVSFAVGDDDVAADTAVIQVITGEWVTLPNVDFSYLSRDTTAIDSAEVSANVSTETVAQDTTTAVVIDSVAIDSANISSDTNENGAPSVSFTLMIDGAVDENILFANETARHLFINFYSYRAEFITLPSEINSLGFTAEVGFFEDDDYLYSLDVSAGVNYIGVMFNFGREFAIYDYVRSVLGVSGGYHYTEILTNFESRRTGKLLAHEYGKNEVYAGVFWKIFPERTRQLDITNRILFGQKTNSARYNESTGEFTHKDGLGITYSISVGYMLRRKGAGDETR